MNVRENNDRLPVSDTDEAQEALLLLLKLTSSLPLSTKVKTRSSTWKSPQFRIGSLLKVGDL